MCRRNVEDGEKSNNVSSNFQSLFVDQRSFTVLANEILDSKTNGNLSLLLFHKYSLPRPLSITYLMYYYRRNTFCYRIHGIMQVVHFR